MHRFLFSLFFLFSSLQAMAYEIFVDKSGSLQPAFVIRHADSLFYYTNRHGLPSGQHVVWLRIKVDNPNDRSQFRYISFDNPVIYKADMYFLEDSTLQYQQFGFGYKQQTKLQVTNIDEFRVNVPAHGKVEVFIRIVPRYISVYSYEVKQLGEMIVWKDQKFYATFIFIFFVAVILLFSFILVQSFPGRKTFLAFIVFQISAVFASTGMTGYYRPFAELVNPVQVAEIFITISLMSCLFILRVFFRMKELYPRADRLLYYTLVYLGLTLLPQIFYFGYQSDYFVKHFAFVPSMLVFTGTTFYLVAKKAKYSLTVAMAFFISTITSTVLNIAFLGYIRLGYWIHFYHFSLVIIIVTLFVVALLQARDRQVVEMAAASLNKLINDKTHKLARIGSWYLDLPTKKFWASDEMYFIYGMEKKETADISDFESKVHPDDKEKISKIWDAMMDSLQDPKMEYRITLNDGSIRHISASWVISYDAYGVANKATGYVQDITERVLAEEEKSAISSELLQRNQVLEEFSYSVSHNLRSPLANILGLCDMIERKLKEGKLDIAPVKMLTESSRRLDSILRDLNTLLNYDKKLNVLKTPLDLDSVAKETWEIYRDKCEFLGGHFTWDFTGIGVVHLVKPYMDNIFQNMLSNSLKYARPGIPPVIHFKGSLKDGILQLEFSDNGLGIDLEVNRSKLFGLYQRFNPKAAEGNGLGLYLIRLQVEKMKGKIDVQSALNTGTTFTITIPV
jgi:PAS domain S-box-containing protein